MDTRAELYLRVKKWESHAQDARDAYPYRILLDDVLFHAERFREYLPYDDEGEFPSRLKSWLDNVLEAEQRVLLRMLQWILFVDRRQMAAMYRDAYRRIVTPWLLDDLSLDERLSPDFEANTRRALLGCRLLSVTESFNITEFIDSNSLHGLHRPDILGHDPKQLASRLGEKALAWERVIVFEDFVGSGQQAGRLLTALEKLIPRAQILFVPMICFEIGVVALTEHKALKRTLVAPVLVVPAGDAIQPAAQPSEPFEFGEFRAIIRRTSSRVLQPLTDLDDPPRSPFGYGDCGGMVITYHNVPNNTIPLVHHRAPEWNPLFRRLVHAKG